MEKEGPMDESAFDIERTRQERYDLDFGLDKLKDMRREQE